VVGGCVGLLAYAILALLVHPQEEPLDSGCQCTRGLYRRERDAVRRRGAEQLGLTAAEESALAQGGGGDGEVGGGAAVPVPAAAAALRRRGGRAAPSHSVPLGARLCDALLFGAQPAQPPPPPPPPPLAQQLLPVAGGSE